MTPAEAIQVAAEKFPRGPERLAELLGAEVRSEPLGVDGWCVRGPQRTIIRLRSGTPETRRRFTLAHEVAHLIYGTRSKIADRGFECYDPKSALEKQANALAARLLLPVPHAQAAITAPVIDPSMIRKLAKTAVVSEQTTALRLATLARELGLGAVAVFAFDGGGVVWKRAAGVDLSGHDLHHLYERAQQAVGRLHRQTGPPGRVLVASALFNPTVPTLVVQELPSDQALTTSAAEKLRAASVALFAGDEPFRHSLEGKFGAFKPKVRGLSLDEAIAAFLDRYRIAWESPDHAQKFLSAPCQRYIRLKLSQWVD